MNRVHGAAAGWIVLPIHYNEFDSLLEALHRGTDQMTHGPSRASASRVADRLSSLHLEFSRRAAPNGNPG